MKRGGQRTLPRPENHKGRLPVPLLFCLLSCLLPTLTPSVNLGWTQAPGGPTLTYQLFRTLSAPHLLTYRKQTCLSLHRSHLRSALLPTTPESMFTWERRLGGAFGGEGACSFKPPCGKRDLPVQAESFSSLHPVNSIGSVPVA